MSTAKQHRASLTRAFHRLEEFRSSTCDTPEAVRVMIGAVASHLGSMLHALTQRGLENDALGIFAGLASYSASGYGSVLAPPDNVLWRPDMKSFKWGPVTVAGSGIVVIQLQSKNAGDAESIQAEEQVCTALAKAVDELEITITTLIGEEGLAATIGALANYTGYALYEMRKQGKSRSVDQFLEILLRQAKTGKTSGPPAVH